MLKCQFTPAYTSAKAAGKVAKKCKQHARPGADRLRIYLCPECGRYHLTRQKRRGISA